MSLTDFRGKTAVITGAGSGFGRAFAVALAAEGANLVLADLEAGPLNETARLLGDAPVLQQLCDVREPAQVDTLASAAYEHFGAVHLLFNNAGVALSGPSWTATLEEWRWVLEVNLMGVVHGLRSFTQAMIDSGEPARIINTASAAGLLSVPGSSVYCVSKHAVVTLSECLHHELKMLGSAVGVSVLCPAFVKTGIADSDRLRPDDTPKNPHPMTAQTEAMTRHAVNSGKVSADDIARMTLDGIREDRFYILTHPGIKASIEGRMRHILDDQPPHNTMLEKP